MTKIAWCDETINPIVGCSKISAGCQNCYAENMAKRLAAMGMKQYQEVCWNETGFGWSGKTAFTESELQKPMKWKAPRSIFVGSMGDMFHNSVPFEWIDDVMRMVWDNPRHTFIFLTKRPDRMREYFTGLSTPGTHTDTTQRLLKNPNYAQQDHGWHLRYLKGVHLHNLALGVTAEDQDAADERIPILLQIPAAIRFVSVEPMVGPVDLLATDAGDILCRCQGCETMTPGTRLSGVILGGESGSKARRIDPQWVRDVRDQCAAAGVPFMFKQWGKCPPKAGCGKYHEGKDAHKMAYLDGSTHLELPWKTRKSCEP